MYGIVADRKERTVLCVFYSLLSTLSVLWLLVCTATADVVYSTVCEGAGIVQKCTLQ